jgi:hypothetical protein
MSRLALLITLAAFLNACGEEAVTVPDHSVPDGYAALSRPAFVPVTEPGDGAIDASKFSGLAFIPEGQEWPACGHCELAMQLFLQLDLATLPERPHGLPAKGLLQVFYCTNFKRECDINTDAWDVFKESAARVTRIVATGSRPTPVAVSPVPDAFPARRITGWKKVPDYPGYEEALDLGYELPDDVDPKTVEGEKLLGWPYWAQSPEYPACPECEARMAYLFQIDSDGNLPFMFGDAGIAHVTFCPEHPEKLRFGWACY